MDETSTQDKQDPAERGSSGVSGACRRLFSRCSNGLGIVCALGVLAAFSIQNQTPDPPRDFQASCHLSAKYWSPQVTQ